MLYQKLESFKDLLRPNRLDEKIRRRSTEEFATRKHIHSFCREFLNEYRQGRLTNHKLADISEMRIWCYWAQGVDQVPPVVNACLNQLRKMNPDREIIIIDDQTIDQYVKIPAHVYEKPFANKTHFSDILRAALLAEYGGIWIDTTCYCSQDLNTALRAMIKSGFFAYSRNEKDTFMLSSWFMAALPNQMITVMMRDALYYYWKTRSHLEHYFLFHFIFEGLYNLSVGFQKQWDSSYKLNAYDPHVLQSKLFCSFDESEWKKILELSCVHKLTYKFNNQNPYEGTYLSYILNK